MQDPRAAPLRERGVIGDHGPGADRDGVHPSTQPLDKGAGWAPADPARLAARRRNPTIEAGRELQRGEGAPALDARHEAGVEPPAVLRERAHRDLQASPAQLADALARGSRIGISHADYHFADARRQHRIDTGRCTTLVGTWLQRHVERGAVRGPSGPRQRHGLCMRTTGARVVPLGDAPASPGNHAAHQRIRGRPAAGACGQPERLTHEDPVCFRRPRPTHCARGRSRRARPETPRWSGSRGTRR